VLRDRERDRRTSPSANEREPISLRCAACDHRITDDAYRIEMSGSHEHSFVNPAGVVHRIGCFHPAPGCVYRGSTETAFSWFPGWTWQIAVCASCGAHVGWIYRSAGEQFHGLVLAALRRG
jgi:hypothetical protein